MTNSNVLPSIVPFSGGLATNPSEITGNPDIPASDPTEGMSREEARIWARSITERLRDQVAEVCDAQLTYIERRDAFIVTMKEATLGNAWRRMGYESWDAWVAGELTADRIYRTVDEKHDLIDHLRANGFSQSKIAPLVDMTRQGVNKYLKGWQGATQLPPATPGTAMDTRRKAGGSPTAVPVESAPATSGQSDRKTTGLDGKEYSAQRTHEQIVADWLRFKGLMTRGWSQNRIGRELGMPRKTVESTLAKGRPMPREQAALFITARTTILDGGTKADACQATGLHMEAIDWLLDPDNRLPHFAIIDQDSVSAWQHDHGNPLRLVTGQAVTQKRIGQIMGLDQSRISQIIGTPRARTPMPAPVPAMMGNTDREGEPAPTAADTVAPAAPITQADYDRPVGADWHYSTDPATAAIEDMPAARLEERYEWRNTGKLDYGCRQFLEELEEHIMEVDPTNGDQAGIYYEAACRVITDAMPHLMTAVNLLSTYNGLIGDQGVQDLYDMARSIQTQIDRNTATLAASPRTTDHDGDDWR